MTITADAAALLARKPSSPGPHFNGNHQYQLRLPGEPKARGRTRVTTFIKALDKGDGLIDWKATLTMVGALRVPGLHAKWAALYARSTNPWYESPELKAECKALVEECAKAGGAESRADVGTALHTMLELIAIGQEPALVDPYAADVAAFRAALAQAHLSPIPAWTEVCVYIPEFDLVGTFDGLFGDNAHRRVLIGDYKTESSTDFKALMHAAQLAAYSLAKYRILWPEDPEAECELVELPDRDMAEGVIFHIPAGEGRCELHLVDLEQGRYALDVAARMRVLDARRKRKDTGGLMRPWVTVGNPPPKAAADEPGAGPAGPFLPGGEGTCAEGIIASPEGVNGGPLVTATAEGPRPAPEPQPLEAALEASLAAIDSPAAAPLKARMRAIGEQQAPLAAVIAQRWPLTKRLSDPWTDAEAAAVAELLAELDVEGPMVDEAELARIAPRFEALDHMAQARISAWVGEAAAAARNGNGRDVGLGGGFTTVRRVALAEAAMAAANLDAYSVERLTSEAIPGAAFDRRVGRSFGFYLAQANYSQALHLRDLMVAAARFDASITTDDGRHDEAGAA